MQKIFLLFIIFALIIGFALSEQCTIQIEVTEYFDYDDEYIDDRLGYDANAWVYFNLGNVSAQENDYVVFEHFGGDYPVVMELLSGSGSLLYSFSWFPSNFISNQGDGNDINDSASVLNEASRIINVPFDRSIRKVRLKNYEWTQVFDVNTQFLSCTRSCLIENEFGSVSEGKRCCNEFTSVDLFSGNGFVCVNCGDGICGAHEDIFNCSSDCLNISNYSCGYGLQLDSNGLCFEGEDINGICGNGVIDYNNGEECDNAVSLGEMPINNCSSSCIIVDTSNCGNNVCDLGEDYSSCPIDCELISADRNVIAHGIDFREAFENALFEINGILASEAGQLDCGDGTSATSDFEIENITVLRADSNISIINVYFNYDLHCTELCKPNWSCSAWNACDINDQSTQRECVDLNGCTNPLYHPMENAFCDACYDSDSQDEGKIFGGVSGADPYAIFHSLQDICFDDFTLGEAMCNYSFAEYKTINCNGACKNGVCVSSPKKISDCEALLSEIRSNISSYNTEYELEIEQDFVCEETIDDSFTGKLYGRNHTITILQPLFREIYYSGRIEGLILNSNIQMPGNSQIGALANTNYGEVEGVSTIGTTIGNSVVGGITGSNFGTISNSINGADVSGNDIVGGITGTNAGTINNCTNTGTITTYIGNQKGDISGQ